MPRYALTLEYDGSRFYGWQCQDGLVTVQQTLEKAITAFALSPVSVYGAGRTDTGVHATGQVAHVDLIYQYEPYRVMAGVNHFLRDSGVVILKVEAVDDTFHARFSAQSRTYIYKILNRRPQAVIDDRRAWHVILPLDLERMKAGAQYLLGTHDFTSFRSAHCQASSAIRTLNVFNLWQEGAYIFARIQSRSFLHNQVRIMMGTLVDIGRCRWEPDIIPQMFVKKTRTAGGVTAPPYGLYLSHIEY